MNSCLLLEKLNHEDISGIYPAPDGNQFPKRMAYLHPMAKKSFRELYESLRPIGTVYVSDMFRSAASSLARRYPGGTWPPRTGVARPAHSAHNYGLAIDVAVDRTIERIGCNKRDLDAIMAHHGWHCHRKDGQRGPEDWHYNYFGAVGDETLYIRHDTSRTTAPAIERKIQHLYGHNWEMSVYQIQEGLAELGLYDDDIDGLYGPKTRAGVRSFQRTWKLSVDGKSGPRTKRMLWFRVSERNYFQGPK